MVVIRLMHVDFGRQLFSPSVLERQWRVDDDVEAAITVENMSTVI